MHDASASAAPPNDLATCQRMLATSQQMVAELLVTVGQLRTTIDKQAAHIQYLVRMTFGRRSERYEGPTLFDGLVMPEPTPPPAEPEPEADGEPEAASARSSKRRGRRQPLAELPCEREVLDLTAAEKACPCCGHERVKIGADVSTRLDYRPASLFRQEVVRPTYICRHCEQQGDNIQAVQKPLPPEPIPHGSAGAGLLAHVIVSKWMDHLPLYRLESILARLGWSVSRSTLCAQMMACARLLRPVYDLMCRRVKTSYALYTDDTPVTLLNPHRTAYAWVYVGDRRNPYTVFELTVGRGHEHPERFLAGYRGFIHADGFTGYNPLYAAGATHIGCWMHVRRKFFDAKGNDPARAHEALARIRELYAIEAKAKDDALQGTALAAYRQEHAGPLLWSFADWLAKEVPKATPKSNIGEALGYAANQWPTLVRYINDGLLTIDNSAAEQAIRPLAVGRRNWLQIAGDGGLASAAVLLSIAASVKRHGVNPWPYVKDLLTQCAARQADSDLTDLLPEAWARLPGAASMEGGYAAASLSPTPKQNPAPCGNTSTS